MRKIEAGNEAYRHGLEDVKKKEENIMYRLKRQSSIYVLWLRRSHKVCNLALTWP